MFPEYIRVKQVDTDWELSVTRSMYAAAPYAYVELDEPATDSGNNPLPPTHKVSAGKAEKQPVSRQADKTGHEADTTKES
jgi:hypothetical protein